ncbi:MAG TPA: hypothetical protein DD619_00005 [Alphaproteobacteria bacterium]|nr:hypothetical protein [Alphaproteobacteria bacterium]
MKVRLFAVEPAVNVLPKPALPDMIQLKNLVHILQVQLSADIPAIQHAQNAVNQHLPLAHPVHMQPKASANSMFLHSNVLEIHIPAPARKVLFPDAGSRSKQLRVK